MRLTTILVSLACALGLSNAAVLPFPSFGPPPNATIVECGDDTDLLKMDYYSLEPNPPQKGQNLTIEATATLSEDVVEGAKIFLVVKVGVIKLLTKELDFCEESVKVDKPCPLVAGPQSLSHTVELPKEIPPGKYVVNIKVKNPDDKQVTCLVATAVFGL
ncbi:Phosphatidylglycerol/phosphatidylinositol transfer protein [Gryganskiella cystojenkinii]|nr:Phosphatidylglycerol/phosphatidylinositol transfer protein [Gryganskiella cystojenkinii]